MNIRSLTLRSRNIGRLHAFYGETLGLPVEAVREDRLTLRVGETRLTFTHDAAFTGFSHFAFTVPENQIGAARAWLAERVPLLADGAGETLFHSESFDSHNLYFEDADGNIAELIARHGLRNRSDAPFGPASLLHVSEIGLVVPDVPERVRALGADYGLVDFNGGSDTFTAVGSHEGMFITVREGRGWFPVGRPAPCVPFELEAMTERGPLHYVHPCDPDPSSSDKDSQTVPTVAEEVGAVSGVCGPAGIATP